MDAESIAIMANHLQMTKYPSQDDEGYKKVCGNLQLMSLEANIKIQTNWQREETAIRV